MLSSLKSFSWRVSITCATLAISACSPRGHPSTEKNEAPSQTKGTIFIDSDQPPITDEWRLEQFQEQFAKCNDIWINIGRRTPYYVLQPDGSYRPCYVEFLDGDLHRLDKTLYAWRDVRLTRSDIPLPVGDTMNRFLGIPSKEFVVREIEAPIQFVRRKQGGYLIGHFDYTCSIFYYFRGYLALQGDIPPKSAQHRCPVVQFPDGYKWNLVPIEIPNYLSKKLRRYHHQPPPAPN